MSVTLPESDVVASEFSTDFAGFKKMASEFFARLKSQTTTHAQSESGLKSLRLAFIYLRGTDLERHQAEIVLVLAQRHADNRFGV